MSSTVVIRGHDVLIDDADRQWIDLYRWSCVGRSPYQYIFYRSATRTPQTIYLHRLITGALPGMDVDHINGDTLDNRRANLRVVPHQVNIQNRRGAQVNSRLGVRNVSMTRYGRYHVQVHRDRKKYSGGNYQTLGEAVEAAARLRARIFGDSVL